LAAIESAERDISTAKQQLSTPDVDIEGLNEMLIQLRGSVDQITARSLQSNIDAVQQNIASTESRKTSLESSIEHLKREIKNTDGKATGCVLAALFFFSPVLFGPIIYRMPSGYLILAVLILAGTGNWLGNTLEATVKTAPERRMIEEHKASIIECDNAIPSLVERAGAAKNEQRLFQAWQAQHQLRRPQV
jgi:hypothetical protein